MGYLPSVAPTARAPGTPSPEVRPSAAQTRVIDAALALFAEHGVSGTSLQMIADAIGVTKAAVYHQFKTKEEIVHAAAAGPLSELEAAVEAAEAEGSRERAVEVLLVRAVDLAVGSRKLVSNLQGDPVMARFLAEDETYLQLTGRLHRILTGGDTSAAALVRAAAIATALGGTAAHPLVADVDDGTLRRHLTEVVQELMRC